MARTDTTIGDATPLDALSIDIPARIGWLLRICRTAEGVSVRDMAGRLGDVGVRGARSPGAISQLETKGLRSGRLIDGYEAALGYPQGRLRAVIDILCRTYDYAPADVAPRLDGGHSLQEIDEALAAVEHAPSGSDWLRLARLAGLGAASPLPTRVVAPLVSQAMDELVRSVGPAFYLRWEALARFQDGHYAPAVLEAARRFVDTPGAEPMATMAVSLTSERPSRGSLRWFLALLEHPSYDVFRGAAFGIGNMRHVGGLEAEDWSEVVEPFVSAHGRWVGTPRGALLTELFKNLPAECRGLIDRRLTRPLQPLRGPASWEAGDDNEHWTVCEGVSARVAAAHGLSPQPLLTRMLFETLYDFRCNVTTSSWLLSVTPLAPALHAELFALVGRAPDEASRTGALRSVFTSATPASDAVAARWYAALPVEQRCDNLQVAEQFALPVPPQALGLVHDGSGRGPELVRALGSSGQAADLHDISTDPRVPAELRRTAAWWVEHGGRVSV